VETRATPPRAYWAAARSDRAPLAKGRGRGARRGPTSRVERFVGLGQSRLFGRRGSSSENTREEAGRPDARVRAWRRSPPQRVMSVACERAARRGRALPEASLESVLGGEGRGAQPDTTTHLLSRGRALGVDSPHARGLRCRVVGPARPSAGEGALLGPHRLLRVGEKRAVGQRAFSGLCRRDTHCAQRVTVQTSARALG